MDAFILIKKDHQKIKKIFKKINNEKDYKKRDTIFLELEKELEAHAYMEENAFYPAMRETMATHTLALQFYEEHHVAHLLLKELAELPKYKQEWDAKLVVLMESVEQHIKKEESIFPKAKKILSKRAKELGKEMERIKEYYFEQFPLAHFSPEFLY